jgi:hypothetical protein
MNKQSRDTGNINLKGQPWIDNPETLFIIAPSDLDCHCLWIVYSSLPLQIFVASVSGLSIHHCPFRFMLPVSLDSIQRHLQHKSEGAIMNKQSRDTGNINLKGQSWIDNRETLAPLDFLFIIAPSDLDCHCLWIVYSSLPLQIFVASVSGLSIHHCPSSFMLPVSLDCLFMIAPSGLCFKCLWIVYSWFLLQIYVATLAT